jgi:hypothetical protein
MFPIHSGISQETLTRVPPSIVTLGADIFLIAELASVLSSNWRGSEIIHESECL